jgi:hypothetical protein
MIAGLIATPFGILAQEVIIHNPNGSTHFYLYQNGSYFKIQTSEIWILGQGEVEFAEPVDFIPASTPDIALIDSLEWDGGEYDAPVGCGNLRYNFPTLVSCGPYLSWYANNKLVKKCYNSNDYVCHLIGTNGKEAWFEDAGVIQE